MAYCCSGSFQVPTLVAQPLESKIVSSYVDKVKMLPKENPKSQENPLYQIIWRTFHHLIKTVDCNFFAFNYSICADNSTVAGGVLKAQVEFIVILLIPFPKATTKYLSHFQGQLGT